MKKFKLLMTTIILSFIFINCIPIIDSNLSLIESIKTTVLNPIKTTCENIKIIQQSFYNIFLNKNSKIESKAEPEPLNKKVIWINVFIHGTVGSTLAFFNFSSITNDKIENTNYKKMVNLMRKDRFMFQDQPIFDKGLIEIDPHIEFCFDRKKVCYGAYPILNLFNHFLNFSSIAKDPDEKNAFFLFGWSGFLSQKRRRAEAIRAYNQIAEKVKFYESLGFSTKVRILAHSHGGNVALNLGGIGLSFEPKEEIEKFYNDFEIGFYVKSAFENLLENLPEKDVAFTRKGQKKFDYSPDFKFKVNELVMLGTPLQEETLLFSSTNFFDITYNIYSEADVIQALDFVTTIKKQSLQRVENFEINKNKLCQVQIVIKHPDETLIRGKPSTILNPNKKTSWWQVVLGLKDTSRKLPDPTHRELWFIVGEDGTIFNFLRPIPMVCFFPIIQRLQNETKNMDNLLIIEEQEESISFELKTRSPEKTNLITPKEASIIIKKIDFLQIKEQLKPWIGLRSNLGGRSGLIRKFIKLERKYNL